MKKIYNYINFKLSSFKIKIIIILLFFYQFLLFFELINQEFQYNIYDLLIKQFNYLPLFIVISLGYLLIIHDMCNKTNFYKYLELRFSSKIKLFNINILLTFISSFLFVLLLNLLAIFEGFGKFDFSNSWSDYFFNNMSGNINIFYSEDIINVITESMTPLKYVLCTNLFIILYLFFLGSIFLAINSCIKKRTLTFLIIIIFNGLNMGFDSFGKFGEMFSFTHNIYLVTSNATNINNNLFIIYRICYWLGLLLIAYFIGKYFIMKTDCRYEE